MRYEWSLLLWAATTALGDAHGPYGAHLKHKHNNNNNKRAVDARIPWTTADGPLPTKLVVFKQIIEVYNGGPHSDKPASFFYETILTPGDKFGGHGGHSSSSSASTSNPGSGSLSTVPAIPTHTSSTQPTSQPTGSQPPPSSSTTSVVAPSSGSSSSLSTGSQPVQPPPSSSTKSSVSTLPTGSQPPPSSSTKSSMSSLSTGSQPPPTSSTSSSTNNANPSSGTTLPTSGASGDKGVCWDKGSQANLAAIAAGPGVMGFAKFNHNWDCYDPAAYGNVLNGMPASKIGGMYVPMLKNWVDDGSFMFGNWDKNVKAWGSKIDMLLTFNEPDVTDGTQGAAAEGFIQYAQPYTSQFAVVAPSPRSTVGVSQAWMEKFFQACSGKCTPKYLATNYYQTQCEGMEPKQIYDDMITYLTGFRTAMGKVWTGMPANIQFVLPEVGCRDSSTAGTAAFLTYLQSQVGAGDSLITRFFWFGLVIADGSAETSGAMVDGDGQVLSAFKSG